MGGESGADSGDDTSAHPVVHQGGSGSGSAAKRRRRPTAELTAVRRAGLPAAFAAAVDRFERHLTLERNMSPHSVRAYVGDVVGLLDHLEASALH